MKSWKKPTDEMVDKTLKLVKKGTGSRYFFSRLKNPLWIQPLVERGYFQSPPSKIKYFDDYSDDVYVQYPSWPELQYLKNMSRDVPDEVINLILDLPKVDNPSVYNEILEIALQLHGDRSAQLKPKILEYTEIILEFSDVDLWLWTHKYADLLAHWTAENQTAAALELSKIFVEFAPDPQSKAKEKRRRKDSTDFGTFYETSLEPLPRIGSSGYKEIMSKGVRPLAEKEPYRVARLLIDVTANMIRLRMHQEELNQGIDSSEIWYERLDGLDTGYEAPDKMLVHTLIFACKQVYEKSLDSVVDLDKVLRNQQWNVFKRLRQHLYAQYPNEQTKPWIRELILGHESYHLWEHRYEFQQMIRNACERFGVSLLTEAERTQIFNAIRSGPSKEDFQAWLGEDFTEEKFLQRQHDFHRKQFKPFESVLLGEYVTYFRELEGKATDPISDKDYPPTETKGGPVLNRSPRSPENLANFTDGKLLTYINKWEEKEHFYKNNSWIKIDIEGLAEAFQTVFKEKIIPDANRLRFWMENCDKIQRPIYVRMMINGMQAEVKEKNFDQLDEWLRFGEWVLSHPDQEHEGDDSLGIQGNESRTRPNWYNSRRVVDHFIKVCLEEEVDVPIAAREQLVKLLKMLCTQFDSWLDRDKRIFLDQNNPYAEGLNNTRSRALETLVQFGFWLRRHDSASELPEMTTILEKRFDPETEYPLTLPEYAVLGKNYPWIFSLNKAWTVERKSDFFPQANLPAWLAAFSSFVVYNRPFKPLFEILRDEFDFALQHLADYKKQGHPREQWIDILGEHLFHYYLWGMYPFKKSVGNNVHDTLLERFYQVTDNNREHWATLFNYVGRTLWNTNGKLDTDLKDRVIAFFEWRLEVEEPCELRQFAFWLQAKCLEVEWRLEAYSKILDVCKAEGTSIGMQMGTLCELLPNHTAKVLECFAKLTDRSDDNNIYIQTEEAKTILKVGLESSDENVRQNAECARENLLREGRFDLLDLDD